MANQRTESVGYRKFQVDPLLADGLLGVERDDGGLQRRVASAFDRLAGRAGQVGDFLAEQEGTAAGLAAGLAGSPAGATIDGSLPVPVAADGSPMAYAPAASTAAPGDLTARARYVRDGLIARGLSPVAAAAAAGHGRQESALRADGPNGDAGTSSGIWQWRKERRTALQNFASKRGANWRDTDLQMDFFVHELQTREKTAWTGLQRAGTLEAATEALMHFERPQGYSARNPRAGHGWSNRLAYAQWAATLGGGSPAPQNAPAGVTALDAAAPAPQGAAGAVTALATGGDVAPPGADAAAPAEAVVEISGSGAGGFRPTGGFTIRDRAYDAAGTRTYLERLDSTMRADIDAVFNKFGADPAALETGLQALRTVHREDHVFPEIAADYETAFERMAQPYRRQALSDQKQREQISTRLEFLERTTEFEEGKARLIETFDASNEDAGAALASAQQAVDAHYDSAVARGVMDADDAFKAKNRSRREAAVGFYGKQGAALSTPEEVAVLRETMRQDFVDGTLEGVDADGWSVIDATLERQESAKRTAGTQAAKALADRGDQLAEFTARGIEPGADAIGRFMLDGKTAPGGAAIVDETMEKIGAARIIREKSLDEADHYVRKLEQDPAAIASGAADFARRELSRMETDVKRDPIGAAVAKGILPEDETILEAGTDPYAVADRVRARIIKADTAAEHFGVEAKYLRPGEATAIKALAAQDPDAAAQVAGGLISGAGRRAGALLAELGDEAPAIQQAGAILAGGGSAAAARDVIAGHGKGPDGKEYPAVKFELRNQVAAETLGDAFVGVPMDGHRTLEAAHAIAKARAVQLGVDPKSDDIKPIFERALQEASGAVFEKGVQYGGLADVSRSTGFISSETSRTIVPPTIRADRFGELIEAIRDQDLAPQDMGRSRPGARPYFSAPPVRENGKPYSAADIKAARPVAVAGGYRFAAGDPASDDPQWIRGADGRPFVLALDGMRRVLEPRVPGAYR
ncbi:hypothetical protein GTW51_10025 [Aurantimonas aggregata]|uniref:Phage tail lysozyme domain-containing protein n=1 Tax=Aurantimonas aggregata TaxID=2047720 RepID=A0A6L9MHA4_9HYPH|nr:phage tail tip lysozyme [Aurantimonas aggregata]NDV87038.1 hypothetical protein [Aurantimonas aggregata]